MTTQIKLIVFGMDETYNLYVLLDDNNDIFTRVLKDGDDGIFLLIGAMFISLLGFDMSFSTPILSSVDLYNNVLTIYYHTTIPVDTFNKEGYKWVKVNETVYNMADGDNRTKVSLASFNAIHTATGQRKYDDFASRK